VWGANEYSNSNADRYRNANANGWHHSYSRTYGDCGSRF
jgi:hypothetical protein